MFGSMSALVDIRVDHNRLSGTLPPSLGSLANLQTLYVHSNNLKGTLPASVVGKQSLLQLFAYDNDFSGSIPIVSLGIYPILSQRPLTDLQLHHNRLSGPLPSFSGLVSLRTMYIHSNQLNGTLPVSVGELQSLVHLFAYENNFTGTIPNVFTSLQSLTRLQLDHNRLSGPLPPSLGDLGNLQCLRLSNNELSGVLPAWLSRLASLTELQIANNGLRGQLPGGGWPRMTHLGPSGLLLSGNRLAGAVVAAADTTSWWYKVSNNGTGLLPQEIGSISSTSLLTDSVSLISSLSIAATKSAQPLNSHSKSVSKRRSLSWTHSPLYSTSGNMKWQVNATSTSQRLSTITCLDSPSIQPLDSYSKSVSKRRSSSYTTHSPLYSITASVVAEDSSGRIPSAPAAVVDVVASTVLITLTLSAVAGSAAFSDAAALAGLQLIPCSAALRTNDGGPSGRPSPLAYILSPFSDFQPSSAALGNVGLMVTVVLIQLCVVAVLSRHMHRTRRCTAWCTWADLWSLHSSTMARVYFPSASLIVFAAFTPGTVRSAVLSVFSTSSSATVTFGTESVAAVVVVAVAVCSGAAAWHRCVQWSVDHAAYASTTPRWVTAARNALCGSCRVPLVVLPTGRWSPRSAQRRFGAVFGAARGPTCVWLLKAALVQTTAFVAISAAPVSASNIVGCTALHIVLAVVGAAPMIAAIYYRPYRVPVMSGFAAVLSFLVSLMAVVTAAGLLQLPASVDSFRVALSVLSLLQQVVMGVKCTVIVATRVLEFWHTRNHRTAPALAFSPESDATATPSISFAIAKRRTRDSDAMRPPLEVLIEAACCVRVTAPTTRSLFSCTR